MTRKLFRGAVVGAFLFIMECLGGTTLFFVANPAAQAVAQQLVPNQLSTVGSQQSFVAGVFVANNYNAYGSSSYAPQIATGNSTTGTSTITVRGGYIVLPDGRGVVPFAVGVPFIIDDATPEMITPTAVSGCYKAQGMNQADILVTCAVTATFSFTHGVGAPITSGTGGLAEALQDAFNWASNSGTGATADVVIAPGFMVNTSCTNCFAGKSAALLGVVPYPNVNIVDYSTANPLAPQPYDVRPTANTAIAAPSAPTFTVTAGAASYYGAVGYVDIYGQISAWTEVSAQLTSATFPMTVTAPAASTGAVGYVIALTASGGASKSETMYVLNGNNCTLTKLETVIPACSLTNATYGQLGVNATLSAVPPTTTAKPNAFAAATDTANNTRTTGAYQPVASNAMFPFSNILASLAASSSGNTGTYEMATLNLPISFFNEVAKNYDLCLVWETTPANTATVRWNVYYGPYNNSDTLIATTGVESAFTGSGAHTENTTCFDLSTITTGSSGSMLAAGYSLLSLASSNVGTLNLVQNSTSSPIIGSLPLNSQQQLRIEAVVGTANLGAAITIDKLSLVPRS